MRIPFLGGSRPAVTISAEGSEIVFRCKDREERAQPIARLHENGLLIAVGVEAVSESGGELVRFFETSSSGPHAARMFFRYFTKVAADVHMLDPIVAIDSAAVSRVFGESALSTTRLALEGSGFEISRATS